MEKERVTSLSCIPTIPAKDNVNFLNIPLEVCYLVISIVFFLINLTNVSLKSIILCMQIRVKIWKGLNSSDLARMRLLSRQFKQEIEQHLDFHINLDQGF